MSGFGFCFYCRKIWFPWLTKCELLRKPRSWEYLFEKVVMPFHCPLTIGSEMQKAEQKPYHPSLLLSPKSSHWLLVTLLQGDNCTRPMSSHHLALPLEWFNHKAVTGKASKAAKRAQWPSVCPWKVAWAERRCFPEGAQPWCAQEPTFRRHVL